MQPRQHLMPGIGGDHGTPTPASFQRQPEPGYGQPIQQQSPMIPPQTDHPPMGGYPGGTSHYFHADTARQQQQHPGQDQHALAQLQPSVQPQSLPHPPAAAPPFPPTPTPQEGSEYQQLVQDSPQATATGSLAKKAFASLGKSFRRATDKVTHRHRGVGGDDGGHEPSRVCGQDENEAANHEDGAVVSGAASGATVGGGGILGRRAGGGGAALAEVHRAHRALDAASGAASDTSPSGGVEGGGGIGPALARYPVMKLRTWRTGYPRILSLHRDHFVTLDPDTCDVTNRWSYAGLRQWMSLPKEEGCVLIEVADGASYAPDRGPSSVHDGSGAADVAMGMGGVAGSLSATSPPGGTGTGTGTRTKLKFRCAAQSDLLCRMLRQKYEGAALEYALSGASPTFLPGVGVGGSLPGAGMSAGAPLGSTMMPFPLFLDCSRHTRHGTKVPCSLLATPFGVMELSCGGEAKGRLRALRTYAYTELRAISLAADDPTGVVLHLRCGGVSTRPFSLAEAAPASTSATARPSLSAATVAAAAALSKCRLFYVSSSFRTGHRSSAGGGGSGNHARTDLVAAVKEYCSILGIEVEVSESMRVQDWLERRRRLGSAAIVGESVCTFPVVKQTNRHSDFGRVGHVERELVISRGGYLLERDRGSVSQGGSCGVAVGCRSLSDVRCLVRRRSDLDGGPGTTSSVDDDKTVTIEFADGSCRSYSCQDRDSLVVSLIDACASLSGNMSVTVTDSSSRGYRFVVAAPSSSSPADRCGGSDVGEQSWPGTLDIVSRCLKRVHRVAAAAAAFLDSSRVSSVDPTKALDPAEECGTVVEACKEFNANVSPNGCGLPDDRKTISGTVGALWGIIERLLAFAKGEGSSPIGMDAHRERTSRLFKVELVLIPLYQTLFRLCRNAHGFKNALVNSQTAVRSIQLALSCITDDFAGYWFLMTLGALLTCVTGDVDGWKGEGGKKLDKESEYANKSVILGAEDVINGLVERMLGQTFGNGDELGRKIGNGRNLHVSELTLAVVGTVLESVLCSGHDTTAPEHFTAFLAALSSGHRALMSMLRSSTPLITENTSLLLHLLTTHSPSTSRLIREDALSSGIILQHFHAAVFSPLEGQRFLSRYLCGLWFSGDRSCREKRLLRRVVPPGFLEYLDMPMLSQVEEDQLDEIERSIEEGEQSADCDETGSDASGAMSAAAGTNTRRLRSRIGIAATAAIGYASSGSKLAKPENFRIFFHVLTKDHSLPDLIWNQTTRRELRIALETELMSIKRASEANGGPDAIAWNHQQFNVSYPSLREEVRVGRVYMRLWLQAGDGFIKSWDDPSGLFEVLFRRLLCDLDRDNIVTNMCIRCLTRLYAIHWSRIGPFSDIMILVRSLSTTRSVETQHRLLALVATLLGVSEDVGKYGEVNVPDNAEQLLNEECLGQLCQFVAWGHTDRMSIKNLLTGAVGKKKALGMLTYEADTRQIGTANARPPAATAGSSQDDLLCPPVWFVAPAGRIPPRSGDVRGPFRVSDLVQLMKRGELHSHSLVTTSHVEDYGFGEPEAGSEVGEAHIDTGKWRPLNAVWQLRWQLCTDDAFGSNGVFDPSEVALIAVKSLSRLVDLHDSVDTRGIRYFPIPIAKQLLCGLARKSSTPSIGDIGTGTSSVRSLGEDFAASDSKDSLAIIAQSILSPDPRVVDAASSLLQLLMEHNDAACVKLYLTGVYFFALQYAGNNFRSIAKLLHQTHLKQHFRAGFSAAAKVSDLPPKERSILGHLLPEGVLLILMNYGYERFADVFVGDFDTPEVIWSLDMRKYLVEMIRQHLGKFPQRLGQHTTAAYDYCPMPGVAYQKLEGEMFCHNYYLRNLVDEERFSDWPIAEPVEVFRSCLEEWKQQMSRDMLKEEDAQEKARILLGLNSGDGGAELRKAYRGLARKFHPDKNPAGRDMFEKIQTSYELLLPVVEGGGKLTVLAGASVHDCEGVVTEKDNVAEGLNGGRRQMNSIHLLMKAQLLICRRYPKDVGKYKYPAYRILLTCLRIPVEKVCLLSAARAQFVCTAVELVFQSCLVSPLNAEELVRENGIPTLEPLLDYYINALHGKDECDRVGVEEASRSLMLAIVTHIVHTIAGVAYFESGRVSLVSLQAQFRLLRNWRLCMDDTLFRTAESMTGSQPGSLKRFAFEGIASMARSADLQGAIVRSGMVWPLLRAMLGFDPTMEKVANRADRSEASSGARSQADINDHARLAARALGMLCGVMKDKLSTPLNVDLYEALKHLLTEPIARMLRNSRSAELLRILNGADVETPNCVWNSRMRKELITFLDKMEKGRNDEALLSVQDELALATASFQYADLVNEIIIDGIYVRIFIGLGGGREGIRDIPNCSSFCEALLRFISRCLKQSLNCLHDVDGMQPPTPADIDLEETTTQGDLPVVPVSDPWFEMAVKSLKLLVRIDGRVDDVLCAKRNPATLLSLLELPQDCITFEECSEILVLLSPKQAFADAIANQGEIWRLLKVLEQNEEIAFVPRNEGYTFDSTAEELNAGDEEETPNNSTLRQQRGWAVLEFLTSSPSVATVLVRSTGWLELLGILVGYARFTKAWTARMGAAKTLSRLIWDPNTGPSAVPLLQKFLPLGMLAMLKDDGPESMLRVFDKESETPELIWDAEMRSELRTAVKDVLDDCFHTAEKGLCFSDHFTLSPNFALKYNKLSDELYIGGVYVRLFLKEPTFSLRDPIYFLEMLLLRWSKDIKEFIDRNIFSAEESKQPFTNALTTALQDALDLVTSASVYLCKIHESLCDRLAEWGYMARSVAFLHRTATVGLVGTPMLSAMRLIHVAVSRRVNVEALALVGAAGGKEGVVDGIMKAIGGSPLHEDSGFMVDALKALYQDALGDVECMSMSANLATDHSASQKQSKKGEQASLDLPGDQGVRLDSSQADVQCPNGSSYVNQTMPYASAPSPASGLDLVNAQKERAFDDPLSILMNESSTANTQQGDFATIEQQGSSLQPPGLMDQNNLPQQPSYETRSQSSYDQQIATQALMPTYGQYPAHAAGPFSQHRGIAASPANQFAQAFGHPVSQTSNAFEQPNHHQRNMSYQERSAMQTSDQQYLAGTYLRGYFSQYPMNTHYQSRHNQEQFPNHTRQYTQYSARNQLNSPLDSGLNQPAHSHVLYPLPAQYLASQTVHSSQHTPQPDVEPTQPTQYLQRNSGNFQQMQSQQQLHAQATPQSLSSQGVEDVQQHYSLMQPMPQNRPSHHSMSHQDVATIQQVAYDSASHYQTLGGEPQGHIEQDPNSTEQQVLRSLAERNGLHQAQELEGSTPETGVFLFGTTQPVDDESKAYTSAGESNKSQPKELRSPNDESQPHHLSFGPNMTQQLESPTPIVGLGVDARSSVNPTIVAEQQTVSIPGAHGCAHGRNALLQSALELNLPHFLVEGILENPTLSDVKGPSATKVLTIDLLKLLTKDPGFGMKFSLILDAIPAWSKYKAQDHSLFVSGTEQKVDYFLTDGGHSEKKRLTHE